MKKLFVCTILSLFFVVALKAVPASPNKATITQPDGTEVDVYLRGDEYFSYLVSDDGYLLAYADNGYVEYARISSDKGIVPVGVKATRASERTAIEKQYLLTAATVDHLQGHLAERHRAMKTRAMAPESKSVQKSYPLNGSPKSLVILVNFSDVAFTSSTAKEDFTRLLNEEGYTDENGSDGSARDYFKASSFGAFSPEFVVYGPYTLSNDCKYYGERIGDQNDRNPGQMVIDACNAADADVDFTEFDTDKDGRLDNVFIYYAGYNEAEGAGSNENTIWPHRSKILKNVSLDGVTLRDYACTSELRGRSGKTQCGIGTFCHEFGHVLTLPDLYVTDYSSDHPTPEMWDIMDHGSYSNDGCSPPTYSSYERFYLGWLTPEVLSEEKIYTLDPLVTSNKAYLVSGTGKHNLNGSDPDPKEFFMVENRRMIGMDRLGIPAEGLLVTHIVYNASTWANNNPNNDPDNMGVDIVCAAGTTASPERNVFPGRDNVTKCQFILRDGTNITPLTSITESGELTSFLFGEDPDAPSLWLENGKINDFEAYYGETEPTQIVRLLGKNLTGDVNLTLLNVDRSKYSIREVTEDGSAKYTYTLRFEPDAADSTIDVRVEIKFAPDAVSYEYITDKLLVRSGDIRQEYALQGLSKEPNRIFAPKAYEAQDVSPYSFKASWQKVEAASGYYLSVYTISDEVSTKVEQFSSFETETPKGWTSTFNTVNSQYKASAPCAAFFTTTSDTLVSEEYFMPVSKISFWIHAMNSTGTLKVEAANAEGAWTEVHSEECNASTRSKSVTVDVKDGGYTRFKIYYIPQTTEGGLSFDDFTAHFDKKMTYIKDDELVSAQDTMVTVSGLLTQTEYRYVVASMQTDEQKRYEYVSEPSNEVLVTTIGGEPANSRAMTIVRDADGNYRAYVPTVDENAALFIYTIDGRLVMEIPSTSSEFIIPRLVNGQVYILKYAEKGNQKRKTKVGKLFYQE